MSRDLSAELKTAYDKATMAHLVRRAPDDSNWKAVRRIQAHAEKLRDREIRGYRNHYNARINKERKAIIAKRGQMRVVPKPPFAIDQFSRTSIDRQAQQNVRLAHQQRLNTIDEREVKALKSVIQKPEQRKMQSFRKSFQQAKARSSPGPRQRQKM